MNSRLTTKQQAGRWSSPWTKWDHIRMITWGVVWALFYRPSFRPFHFWRIFLLKLFGCKITGKPRLYPTSIIKMPWKLTLEDQACLGDRCEIYNLGEVLLKERCTVAQQVYLCGGTHDITKADFPLIVGDIVVGREAFIGVRAIILPGIIIGDGAVVGAGSIVTKDIPEWTICAGNPCRQIKVREFD